MLLSPLFIFWERHRLKKELVSILICSTFVVNQVLLCQVFAQASGSSDRIAWVHDSTIMLSDEMSYLVSLDPSRYAYYEYSDDNIGYLWANLQNYKALLIDEDCIYHYEGYKIDEIYNSFYNHRTQLGEWVKDGGGLFITDNNDLYNLNFEPYELTWDWLPVDLVVTSIDVGADASGGCLEIVHDPGLFSHPNPIDDSYINDPSRGHAHGYFTKYEDYSTLMVRTDPTYENAPVEIFRTYGKGAVVISHAELEDGESWRYVQNEIEYVLSTPRERLVSSLDLLFDTCIDAMDQAAWLSARLRAKSHEVLDVDLLVEGLRVLISTMVTGYAVSTKLPGLVSSIALMGGATKMGYTGLVKGTGAAVTDVTKDTFLDEEASKLSMGPRQILYYNCLKGVLQDQEYFHQLKDHRGNSWLGVDSLISTLTTEYEDFKNQLQDPLPTTFPLHYTLNYLGDLRLNIQRSKTAQYRFFFYNVTAERVQQIELGAQNTRNEQLDKIVEQYEALKTLDWTSWGASIGAGVAKIILGTSIPVLGAIVLDAVIFGVKAIADFGTLTRQGMVCHLLDISLPEYGTEVIALREIFLETGTYINKMLKTPPKLSQVSVLDVTTPDIIPSEKEQFGTATGTITIENQDVESVKVTALISIYTEVKGVVTTMLLETVPEKAGFEIPSKAIQDLEFTYTLPVSLFGCDKYTVEIYLTSNHDKIGPFISDFNVGIGCGVGTSKVLEGAITQGQKKTATVSVTSDVYETRFTLYFAGSDIDIHLYDSLGRHVGVDYASGNVVIEIPSALYSGCQAIPEWIKVPNPGDEDYTIEAVGSDVIEAESFVVTATYTPHLPALLTFLPTTLSQKVPPGQLSNLTFTVTEYVGQQSADISVEASNLSNQLGDTIGYGNVSFSSNRFLLPGGESEVMMLNVSVPPGTNFGDYTGNITVVWNSEVHKIPISVIVPDTIPPVLSNVRSASRFILNGESVTVLVDATDAGIGVKNVTLLYSLDDGKTWEYVIMQHKAGDSYQASIQLRGLGIRTIRFYIEVEDNHYNKIVSSETLIQAGWIYSLLMGSVIVGLGSASSFVGYFYFRARKQLKKIRQKMAKSVMCTGCKTLNSPGARFCRKCGKPL